VVSQYTHVARLGGDVDLGDTTRLIDRLHSTIYAHRQMIHRSAGWVGAMMSCISNQES
jgi:hypothetical protein